MKQDVQQQKMKHLPKETSILNADICAIGRALDFVSINKNKKYVIFLTPYQLQ